MKQIKTHFFLVFLCLGVFAQAQNAEGELKRWHKVTLTFNGPNTSETANPNPFLDYNLEVTFTNGQSSYTVPGYYAACDNPAETSCDSGDKWKVHFAPGKTGKWNWKASFKKGTNVAINGGGSSAGFMDGDTGSFDIAESDKAGRDHRAKNKGMLQYVGEHYLKYSGTNPDDPNGDWFIKGGADSPENALAYEDFDNTPNRGKRRKSWNPHQKDYVASDASAYTWKNGKGSEMLGMIKYLSDKGLNAFSFLTLSLHGDDENVFPHLLKVPVSTYNGYNDSQQWNQGVHKDRFDVSKLAQWEKIFEYGDKKGMFMHFKTLETENDNIMDGDKNGTQRKVYYRELIARFGHHLALNWNISEESTIPTDVVKQVASFIKNKDPYDHHIVLHTYPNQRDQRYDPLLGNKSELTGPSIQTNNYDIHSVIKRWVDKSRNAGKKWVVACDEPGNAQIGIDKDGADDGEVRSEVLWATLMAGGMGVEYYYGYQTGQTDLSAQDHRSRDKKYSDVSRAITFFNTYLQPYVSSMVSSDGVTSDSNDHVFAKAGEVYVVYRPKGGSTGINLSGNNNTYEVQWYNPRTGGNLSSAKTVGNNLVAPDNNDWVALITKNGIIDPDPDPDPDPDQCVAVEKNGVAAVEAEHFVSQSKTDKRKWYVLDGSGSTPTPDPDPSHHSGASGGGYLEILPDTRVTHGDPLIQGTNFAPNGGQMTIVDYKVKFSSAGKYFVWVRAYSTGSEDNGVHVGLNGQWPASGQRMQWCQGKNTWTWESKQRTDANHCGEAQKIYLDIPSAGVHTISFSMREDGFEMDKFVLSKSYTKPSGNGPAEILEDCNDPDPDPDPDTGEIKIPGTFEAENYGSKSGTVKIENTPGSSGKNLGFIRNGNFTEYNANITSSGSYKFDFYVSSDGIGGSIEIQQNGSKVGEVNVPVNGQWHNYQKVSTSAQLSAGKQKIKLVFRGGNGYLFNVDKVVTTSENVQQEQTVTLSPIHDAFLENGKRYNTNIVRIENGRRTGYLMFDLSSVNGAIQKAELKFTISDDPGNGNLTVTKGNGTNWTETNLSNTNKPSTGSTLGTNSGSYDLGSQKVINLKTSEIDAGKRLSLVLNATSGNDFAFASKEHKSGKKPQLVITYLSNKNPDNIADNTPISMYPMPVSSTLNFSGSGLKGSNLSIYSITGKLLMMKVVKEGDTSMDVSTLPMGTYIVKIIGDKNIFSKQIVKY